jgi:RNA-directed DNA polymerase
LRMRRYAPQPYRYFQVRRRKNRTVAEASFRDRVVHHALVSAMTPVFEAEMIPFSYACRRGYGIHRAVARTQQLTGRYRYFLKLDIEKYFETLPHDVVMAAVKSRIDDAGILWLCRLILASARREGSPSGRRRGVPIGNLTSQCWGNTVLHAVDGGIQEAGLLEQYQRYMDDMLVFADDKETLWSAASLIRDVVQRRLGLRLKDRITQVAPTRDGVPWLGLRVFSGLIRLDRAGRTRMARKLAFSMAAAQADPSREKMESYVANGVLSHARIADTFRLRQSLIARQLERL